MSTHDPLPSSNFGELEKPRRRMADHKLEAVANSALLRVLQYAITGIALPVIGYGMTSILDRLGKFEEAVNKANQINATVELRLTNSERSNFERDTQLKLLTEASIRHEIEIRALKETTMKLQAGK
jgi:hypothetical protein